MTGEQDFSPRRLPAGLWCILIFVLSSRSSLPSLPGPGWLDKLAHFGTYAILSALIFQGEGKNGLFGPLLSRRTAGACLAAALYGVSDELHQLFVPGRQADPMDLLADALGALAGALCCALWVRRFSGRRKTSFLHAVIQSVVNHRNEAP